MYQEPHIKNPQRHAIALVRRNRRIRRRGILFQVLFKQALECSRYRRVSRKLKVRLCKWVRGGEDRFVTGEFALHFGVGEAARIVLVK